MMTKNSGRVAFANPQAQDWLDNLRQIADKFETALKWQTTGRGYGQKV
jgi:hypothetical protein